MTSLCMLWLVLVGSMQLLPQRTVDGATPRRTVVSLTTSPKRLGTLEKTLHSLLGQTSLPDVIQVNLPSVFLRTNETFPRNVFERLSLLENPLIRVMWHPDVGPLTKLLPTLETETDPETLIIIVDDDTFYPALMVQLMKERINYDPNYIQTGHCGDTLLTNREEEYWVPPYNDTRFERSGKGGGCCCRMHEGYGGVGFRRGMFDDDSGNSSLQDFRAYLSIALESHECFRSDDFVVSNFLTMKGYQGLDLQLRVWQQDYGYESDALHKLEPWGHPYPRCSIHLQRNNISKLRCHGDEWSS